MDRRLIEAADKGDIDKLHNLIKDYPLMLKAAALASGDTPLHIACMGGHVNFVKEVLNLRPEFAEELNQDGLSPLHIASANGAIDIVKELLKLGSHLCLIQGKENRIPFHFAVVKGRIHVIRELLSVCQDSITEVTARGETCFHLAVKNNQFKALKVLCEHVVTFDKEDILNHRDEQGNTILHLAASRKQYEVVDLMLDKNFGYKGTVEVNSLNKKSLTPLDVLVSEGGDCEMEEMLTLAGAVRGPIMSPQNSVVAIQGPSQNHSVQERRRDHPKSTYQKLLDFLKYDVTKDSPSEARNTLLVIAVLIATATYQAGFSAPGGVWQANFWPDAKNYTTNDSSTKQPPPHTTGVAVEGNYYYVGYLYIPFLVFNSIGFLTSLHMMFFLTHGLPMKLELRVALAALMVNYFTCLLAISPFDWMMSLILLIITPLMMLMIVPKVVRACYKKGRSSVLPSARATG